MLPAGTEGWPGWCQLCREPVVFSLPSAAAGQPANGAGNISFGPVAGTRMACPAPSFGNDLASGLEQAQRFTTTIDGRQLVLETPDLRFTFAAAE